MSYLCVTGWITCTSSALHLIWGTPMIRIATMMLFSPFMHTICSGMVGPWAVCGRCGVWRTSGGPVGKQWTHSYIHATQVPTVSSTEVTSQEINVTKVLCACSSDMTYIQVACQMHVSDTGDSSCDTVPPTTGWDFPCAYGWLEGESGGRPCRCGPHLGGGVHSPSHTHYTAVTWTEHREPVKRSHNL